MRTKLLLGFAVLAAACLGALIGGLILGHMRAAQDTGSALLLAGIAAGFAIAGLLAAAWFLADSHIARPVDRIAGDLRARAIGDIDVTLDSPHARHLGDLAPSAQALADALLHSRRALNDARQSATRQLIDEKNVWRRCCLT